MSGFEPDKKDNFTFFKDSIIRPEANIKNNVYLSVMNNIGLFILIFIFTIMASYIAYLPVGLFSRGFEEYAGMGVLVVFTGFIAFLLLIPAAMVNIIVIYILNKKFSNMMKSFAKVVSDHTTILIPTFLLFSIGLYFYSFMGTLRPYLNLGGFLIILISVVFYIRGSIMLVKHYMKDDRKKVAYIYAVILAVVTLFGLPLLANYMYEGFFEQLLVNILMLFEDIGLR